MSHEAAPKCQRCGTEIQGHSTYCIACCAWLYHACPNCMRMGPDGKYRPIKRGRPPKPIQCSVCRGERWVLYYPGLGRIVSE